MPNARLFFNLGCSYTDVHTQAQICYYDNAFGPSPPVSCPAVLGYSPPAVPALGFYSSRQHFVYGGINWKPVPPVTTSLGYTASFVGGSTTLINPLQEPGTLAFNYQTPSVSLIIDLYKGLNRTAWNYYGYNSRGQLSNAIPGLGPIVTPDLNGSTAKFAFRYAF